MCMVGKASVVSGRWVAEGEQKRDFEVDVSIRVHSCAYVRVCMRI